MKQGNQWLEVYLLQACKKQKDKHNETRKPVARSTSPTSLQNDKETVHICSEWSSLTHENEANAEMYSFKSSICH